MLFNLLLIGLANARASTKRSSNEVNGNYRYGAIKINARRRTRRRAAPVVEALRVMGYELRYSQRVEAFSAVEIQFGSHSRAKVFIVDAKKTFHALRGRY